MKLKDRRFCSSAIDIKLCPTWAAIYPFKTIYNNEDENKKALRVISIVGKSTLCCSEAVRTRLQGQVRLAVVAHAIQRDDREVVELAAVHAG